MKIAIIGARGMLGTDLAAAARRAGVEAAGLDLPEVDITREDGGLDRVPACDGVVNVAAFTDVDGAETREAAAFAVNAGGAGRVAALCAKRNVPLIHISTDYVFDGTASVPYREDDRPNPLNAYGRSKLAGEEAVRKAGGRWMIVRTQSLFGLNGRSFVKAILDKLAGSDEPLRVVNDQSSSPTYTGHLAEAILRLMGTGRQGIVHVASTGGCTWYEFACAIAARAKPGAKVNPVSAREYARPARRPAYAVLDTGRYAEWTGRRMPSWQEGLDAYLAERAGGERKG